MKSSEQLLNALHDYLCFRFLLIITINIRLDVDTFLPPVWPGLTR